MILVTLGTQDKSFKRLLDTIQKAIDDGIIKERVVVQSGNTKYTSNSMEIFDLISQDELDKLREEARLIITHAGVGSILDSIKKEKVIIAAARLKKYHEHTNDHQLQILNNFSELGYVLKLENFDELPELLKKAETFKPTKYEFNSAKIENIIIEYIDKLK